MKKLLSLLLVAAMLVSTLIIVSIPTGAVEGDWMVYARKEQHRDDYEDGDYVSVMGYEYTNEGFHTITPDFSKGQSPRGGLQTKTTYDLKDGIYMLVRVDEFSYDAPDKWLNLNLWSEPMVELASNDMEKDGYGVQTIMRPGATDGKFLQLEWYKEGFTQVQVGYEFQGKEDMYDAEGRALFELVVTYDGSSFALTINGIAAPQGIIDYMNETFVEMEAHVGMAFYHTKESGDASFTVLKFGTSKDTAVTPSGDDSREPENFSLDIAPIGDPSAIEEGKPGILINGSKEDSDSYTNAGSSASGNSILNEDNSVTYIASSSSVSVVYKPKNEVSYAIEDFPVVLVLVRNLCTCGEDDGACYACETMKLYLATGEHSSADGEHCVELFACDGDYAIEKGDDSYLYFVIDMQGEFAPWDATGRVNMIRMDFNGIDYNTPGLNQFDLCYVGCFRTTEDAENYMYDYIGVDPEETTEEETTEEETTVADETTVAGGDETTASGGDETTAGGSTEAPAKKGCGSVVSFGAIAVVATVGAIGFVSLKKKKEE